MKKRRVYIVTGQHQRYRKSLCQLLAAVGLEPVPWPGASTILGSGRPLDRLLLQEAFSGAQAILVLLTEDDLAKPNPQLGTSTSSRYAMHWSPQPSPDVLFEAGLAMGTVPERTILVQRGKLRPLDLAWSREIVTLTDSLGSKDKLLNRLRAAGCLVDKTSGHWRDAGDSTAAEVRRQPVRSSSQPSRPAIVENRLLAVAGEDRTFLLRLEAYSSNPDLAVQHPNGSRVSWGSAKRKRRLA